jgi:MFS transporter, DHA2 family, multidrug resistance protein
MAETGPTHTISYTGDDRELFGIVLAVLTFWLFAQTTLNVIPDMQRSLAINAAVLNLAVSVTALVTGIFIAVAGGLADRLGRVRFIRIGLVLSVIGSACIVLTAAVPPGADTGLMLLGRVLQGFSAAAILSSSLAVIKAHYHDRNRQRALSFWSIGSFGGSALTTLVGGFVASTLEWRWNFVIQIVVSVVAYLLIARTPETRGETIERHRFDVAGLLTFLVAIIALNAIISFSGKLFPFFSLTTLVLAVICVVTTVWFFRTQLHTDSGFMAFELFRNRAFSGAVLANFLANTGVAALAIVPTYLQRSPRFGLSPLQTGLLTLGYAICIIGLIRVGEKALQRVGARKPMMLGLVLLGIGVLLLAQTWVSPRVPYLTVAFVGFSLFGIGLGFFATPAVDTAMTNAPLEKAGIAGGIFKMASSLGASMGVAIGLAVSSGLWPAGAAARAPASDHAWRTGTAAGLAFVFAMMVVSLLAVAVAVPRSAVAAAEV